MGGGSTVSAHKVKLKANAKLGVPLVALAQQSDGFGSSDNFLAYRNSNGRFSDDGADTDPGKLFPNCNDCHEVATLLEASG
jgi:hypothetical protein